MDIRQLEQLLTAPSISTVESLPGPGRALEGSGTALRPGHPGVRAFVSALCACGLSGLCGMWGGLRWVQCHTHTLRMTFMEESWSNLDDHSLET